MGRESFASHLFSKATGFEAIVVPEKVTVECEKRANTPGGRLRPSISFNPGDPDSVARARKAASRHVVSSRTCGDHCGLPCTLRRLDNPNDD